MSSTDAPKCPYPHLHTTTPPTTTSTTPDTKTSTESSNNVGGKGTASDFHSTGLKNSNRPGRGGFPVMYHSYLQLDKILDAHECMSQRRTNKDTGEIESPGFGDNGEAAHDEHLFITIHQAYELWFKQMMFEIDDVLRMFSQEHVPESCIGIACRRLKRVTEIQRILLDQLTVLETMTPLGFLEFRDYLFPASGFQSLQFRMLECKLGLPAQKRMKYAGRSYCSYLPQEHADLLAKLPEDKSLFRLLEKWLERTPFLTFKTSSTTTTTTSSPQKTTTTDETKTETFDFWDQYKIAVNNMYDRDRDEIITQTSNFSKEEGDDENTKSLLAEVEENRKHYSVLFDPKEHQEAVERGDRRLSYKALQASLLIMLYQNEPILQQPASLIKLCIDVDELMTLWRHRHALMVHRMIGRKLGTGGSSGYSYLKATAERHKIFTDLFNLSTYMIPLDSLPKLPEHVRNALSFSLRSNRN